MDLERRHMQTRIGFTNDFSRFPARHQHYFICAIHNALKRVFPVSSFYVYD